MAVTSNLSAHQSRSCPSWAGTGLGLIALAVAGLWPAAYVQAGISPGRQIVDSTVVYVGVVPAAVTRAHPMPHVERQMHGNQAWDIHEIHLLVAVFDKSTGERITNARVDARMIGERGRHWTAHLMPMTINGALTYGAYTNLGGDENPSIIIDVSRPAGTRMSKVSARFEYQHD